MIYRADTEYADGRRRHVYVLDVERALEAERSSTGVGTVRDDGDGTGEDADSDGDDSNGDGAITRLTDGDADYVLLPGDDRTVYYASKVGERPDDSLTYELVEHDVERDETEAFTRTTGWLSGLETTTDGPVAFEYTPKSGRRCARRRSAFTTARVGRRPRRPNRWTGRSATAVGSSGLPTGKPSTSRRPIRVRGCCGRCRVTRPRNRPGSTARTSPSRTSVGRDAVAVVQSEWDHPATSSSRPAAALRPTD